MIFRLIGIEVLNYLSIEDDLNLRKGPEAREFLLEFTLRRVQAQAEDAQAVRLRRVVARPEVPTTIRHRAARVRTPAVVASAAPAAARRPATHGGSTAATAAITRTAGTRRVRTRSRPRIATRITRTSRPRSGIATRRHCYKRDSR